MKRFIAGGMLVLLLFGCGHAEEKEVSTDPKQETEEQIITEDKDMNEENITKEETAETTALTEDQQYLVDTYGLTEEEVRGFDAGRFMEDYQVKERNRDAETVRDLIEAHRDWYQEGEEDIFSVFSKKCEHVLEKNDKIDLIAIELRRGTEPRQIVIDLKEKKYYDDSKNEHSITEEQIKKITEAMETNAVYEWGNIEQDQESLTSVADYYTWKVILVTDTQERASFSGALIDGDSLSDHFENLLKEIQKTLSE